MSQYYFLNFPALAYQGYTAVNILERSVVLDSFKNNFELFREYTVVNGQTAEQIANDYYGSPFYTWVIYLFNDIIDPYWQWPLNENNFNNLIIQKYGSYDNASRQLIFFRNNWFGDTRMLDKAGYETLPAVAKKYWSPVLINGAVVSYQRTQKDTTTKTNQIVTFAVTNNAIFQCDEVVYNGTNQGQVTFSNTSVLILDKIIGSFANGNSITGMQSNTQSSVANTPSVINSIGPDEQAYYSPVTYLDIETENNIAKSNICLLKKQYLADVERTFNTLMNNP